MSPLPSESNANQLDFVSFAAIQFRPTRRGGRVAECAGLENRYTRKGIERFESLLSAFFSLRAACKEMNATGYGGVRRMALS